LGRLGYEDLFPDLNWFFLLLGKSNYFSEDFIDGSVNFELFLLNEGANVNNSLEASFSCDFRINLFFIFNFYYFFCSFFFLYSLKIILYAFTCFFIFLFRSSCFLDIICTLFSLFNSGS
jgi:hypothetical protein